MITIAEVIEQCAQEAERCDGSMHGVLDRFMAVLIAGKIRALAEQYEGCIVAEGAPQHGRSVGTPLYRAREAK
jgi:hypothetical protein